MPGGRVEAASPIFDRIVDVAGMRSLEATAPSETNLMQNAGAAISAYVLKDEHVRPSDLAICLVGPGKNGGDALIAAGQLAQAGVNVAAWGSRARPNDPLVAAASKSGVRWKVWQGDRTPLLTEISQASCVIDGLLGIGSSPPLRGEIKELLHTLPIPTNQTRIAIDIPTGIDAETGAADTSTFPADLTLATGPVKIGSLLHPAVEFCGEIRAVPIGLEAVAYESITTAIIDRPTVRGLIPKRGLSGHKGSFGRLAIVGGSSQYLGATALATIAAIRTGVGMVTLASIEPAIVTAATLAPGATFLPFEATPTGHMSASLDDLEKLLDSSTALLIGPGLGRSPQTDSLVTELIRNRTRSPIVFDADALNVLADNQDLYASLGPQMVLTPHPGELRRLSSEAAVPEGRNRIRISENLASTTNATVVAKGSPTIVAGNQFTWILARPNPILATAGSGDVLAGSIAGLLAQGVPPVAAARLGVWLHCEAASITAGESDRGIPIEHIAQAIEPALQKTRL